MQDQEQANPATAQLRAVLESMTDAVYIGGADGMTLVNQAGLDQLGFTSREELNRSVGTLAAEIQTRDANTGEIIPGERQAFARALAGERVVQDVIVRHRRSGEDRVLRCAAAPVVIDGRVVAAVAVNTDVTDRKATEATLRESEQRFRLTADAVPQLVWITDAEGNVEFLNKPWTDYTGACYNPTTAAEITARFVHPDDVAATRAAQKVARETGTTFAVEHRMRAAGGDYRWFLARAEPYRDPVSGDIVRWFGASVDIHDQKTVETALRAGEARQAFLLALEDRLLPLNDADAIRREASRAIGEHLGATRAGYAELAEDGEHSMVTQVFTRGVPNIEGRHRVADYSRALLDQLRAGHIVARDDVAGSPDLTSEQKAAHAALGVGAAINLPLLRGGRLAALLFVHFPTAHVWSPEEQALLSEVAARTWDAMERARTEAALRASERRYRTLFDSIDEGFCVLEVLFEDDGHGNASPTPIDYRFLETNPSFVRQGGFDPLIDGTPSRRMSEIAPIEPEWIAIYGGVALTGEPTRFTHEAASFGRTYDVFAFRVDAPEARHVAVLFRDITAQLVAEREKERLLAVVKSERERLRSVVLHMPAPVAMMEGPEHRFVLVNDAFKRISSGGRDITGLTPPQAFPELAGSGIFELFDRVYETGEPWDGPETLVRYDRDGSGVQDTWFNLRFEPVRDADGAVIALFNFAVDVTDQVLARHSLEGLLDREQQARAAAEESSRTAQAARMDAEAANRAKSEFLAVMSHELRTPLNAIGGYAELIELGIHGPVTEAQRNALERIQRSQRHLLGLIAGVLDYSRVEAGAVTYRIVDVPVSEAVAEAESLVAPQLRAKELGYSWSCAVPGLCARADREKLQQILLNLLGNAAKFTHPRDGVPGRIEVVCTAERTSVAGSHVECVRVDVRDTGEGIAHDELERIFEPFVQADQRLTRPHAGVGLGLAISRDLARGMGGDLTVASTPGVGSTFTLTLPSA